jgi:hypothetical protein
LNGLVEPRGEVLLDVAACESTRNPNLFFVGFPFIRTFASRYIRGIWYDSAWVARRIAGRVKP